MTSLLVLPEEASTGELPHSVARRPHYAAAGVVAGGDQECRGAVGADAAQAAQRRGVLGGQGVELLGEQGDLRVEVLVAPGQGATPA